MSEKQGATIASHRHNRAGGRKLGGTHRNRKCDPLMTLRGAIYVKSCVTLLLLLKIKFPKSCVPASKSNEMFQFRGKYAFKVKELEFYYNRSILLADTKENQFSLLGEE